MADLLAAVESVRILSKDEDSLADLTAIKASKTPQKKQTLNNKAGNGEDVELFQSATTTENGTLIHIPSSPEEALRLLRSQPELDSLLAALRQLASLRPYSDHSFSLYAPGPCQAQIISTLVITIVPTFWSVLKQLKRSHDLCSCLSNVASYSSIIARLRLLVAEASSGNRNGTPAMQQIQDLLDLLHSLLAFDKDSTLSSILENLTGSIDDYAKVQMSWKEFINLIGSGKIIATVAQAIDAIRGASNKHKPSWLASGVEYASWLGRNIVGIVQIQSSDSQKRLYHAAALLLAKAMNLGYEEAVLRSMFETLASCEARIDTLPEHLSGLQENMPAHAQKYFIEHLLRWLSKVVAPRTSIEAANFSTQNQNVSAVAALISAFNGAANFQSHLLTLLSSPAYSATFSLSLRRACVLLLSSSAGDEFQHLLEKLMSVFNDELFIAHAPVVQQETLTQNILLVAGYVYRKTPLAVRMAARSSHHMQGITNRLDSSNSRARWLGMVIGTALSSLVDDERTKMKFDSDEMTTEEAEWLMKLVTVEDQVGDLSSFIFFLNRKDELALTLQSKALPAKLDKLPSINGKPIFGPLRPPLEKRAQTEIIGDRFAELPDSDFDTEAEDEDGLKAHAKPDSDPEDSDDDATLVNRNKATPPVYIRDLMSMLRDDQNAERFQAGLKHAAPLVRRKTNFGAEVRDHAEELSRTLCNLQDSFETANFDELRLQALIALLLSDTKTMAPWLSMQAFVGDYSIAQRCMILSVLGIGGRELAGFSGEDDSLNPIHSDANFPTKQLPSHLNAIYRPSASFEKLESAANSTEHALIRPLALHAADQSTAHLNAVKIRTFSSRMSVGRTKRKPTPCNLAKVFGEFFFSPLVGRYQQEIAAYGSTSVYASAPFVLVTFVKTLALLLHASGPATLGLPQVTAEMLELLLSLRVQAVSHINVLHAVLFAFLTLLETNTDKQRFATDHVQQLIEIQRWVDLILERTGGGNMIGQNGGHKENDEETKVRALAAGVMMKTREILEIFQTPLEKPVFR